MANGGEGEKQILDELFFFFFPAGTGKLKCSKEKLATVLFKCGLLDLVSTLLWFCFCSATVSLKVSS